MQHPKLGNSMVRTLGLAWLLAAAVLHPAARSQELSGYTIATEKDIFLRETTSGLAVTPSGVLPRCR